MSCNTTRSHAFVCAAILVLVLFCAATAPAQDPRGTIKGTITDAAGAVVPKASIKITSAERGTTVTLESNGVGFYQALYLIPGTYTITVEMTGFKKYVRDKIVLRVSDVLVVDAKLEVGPVTETVIVEAGAVVLETASASAGQVIDAKRLAELPIPHGEPYKLMGLTPGTAFARDPRLDRPYEPTHIVGYAMDGTRANRSDLTIDGAPSTATANAGEVISTYVPPQDLIQEFRVQTATFDAQFGNTEGGVTTIQVKSGTKDFHGTVSYTNMTPGLFANDFYANRTGTPRADFFYHRFGGTVTGPIWIPGLYDGRKKTFFTYGYEGIREARPRNNGTFTTPTMCMLGRASCNGVQQLGNFSELLPLGSNYVVYNPFSGVGSSTSYTRTAFTGNIITPSLINPIARAIAEAYWPDPTSAANPDGSNNFLQPNLVENAVYDSQTVRIDHNFNDAHKMFGRVSWYGRASDYNNYFGNISTGQIFSFISRQAIADYVWTINSTTVFNTRYSYNRFIRWDGAPASTGFDLTSVGFPAAYNNLIDPAIRKFPRLAISGYQGTATPGNFRPIDLHSVAATLTKLRGSHAVRAGFEFRSYRENSWFDGNDQTGTFNFDNTYTKGPAYNITNANNLGLSFAAFLLGVPTSATINIPATYAEQSTTWGFFVHDDWKVNRKLTLNIGLRWEFETPMTERYNQSVRQFNFNFIQPIEAAAILKYVTTTPEVPASQFLVRGGLTFAGVGGNPRGLYETPKINLMPRLGLAYSIDQKTVIRAGYGIFFGFLGQRQGDVVQSGFTATTQMNVTTTNGFTFNETLSNPFLAGLTLPQGAAQGGVTFLGQGITVFNPKALMPYMQRWEIGVQRELPWGFVVEAAYIGNRGTHLETFSGAQGSSPTLPNFNVTPQRYLSTSPVRDEVKRLYLVTNLANNPFYGLMPTSAVSGLRGTTIARERLLRPFPEFDSVRASRYDGYSWYHGLQLRLEKRFRQGYTINATYTFSKFMTANELLNDDDARPTEVISEMDYPHRITVSWIYELPFGKGRWLASNANPILDRFIGGWQIQGLWQYQSGNPLSAWGNRIYNGTLGDIRLAKEEQTVERWFNTTGFVALKTSGGVIQTVGGVPFASGGTPIWVDFNDPCKNAYNAATCPGTPLANPVGFNRDSSTQLDHNVRTFPLRFGWLRSDTINNWDLSVLKNIPVNERFSFQFRAEFLNAFNHPWFQAANVDPTSASFGQAIGSTQRNYQRRTQLGLKFIF
jgi:hypothetical protein